MLRPCGCLHQWRPVRQLRGRHCGRSASPGCRSVLPQPHRLQCACSKQQGLIFSNIAKGLLWVVLQLARCTCWRTMHRSLARKQNLKQPLMVVVLLMGCIGAHTLRSPLLARAPAQAMRPCSLPPTAPSPTPSSTLAMALPAAPLVVSFRL